MQKKKTPANVSVSDAILNIVSFAEKSYSHIGSTWSNICLGMDIAIGSTI
jgi:hypothetical protein